MGAYAAPQASSGYSAGLQRDQYNTSSSALSAYAPSNESPGPGTAYNGGAMTAEGLVSGSSPVPHVKGRGISELLGHDNTANKVRILTLHVASHPLS